MKNQQRIGITGGIGSGKSTVCRVLAAMGFPVYYSDAEAKRIMHEDEELIASIRQVFGNDAYLDGKLNRAFIAGIVFRQPEKKEALDRLVHPKVRADFVNWCARQDQPLVFQESALLFETGGYKLLDRTVLVTAPEELRIRRVRERDGLSTEAIRDRIRNQLPDSEKTSLADFTIENDDRRPVLPQVLEMIGKFSGDPQYCAVGNSR